MTEESGYTGVGKQQLVSGDRQLAAEDEFNRRIHYAINSNTHLWIVTVVHYASKNLLAAYANQSPDSVPMLDAETLAMRPMVGCYICEEPYHERLTYRKCKPKSMKELI